MPLCNGEHGYGIVTKILHWLTVAAIIGQFLVGWTMEADDEALDREKDRIDALEDAGARIGPRARATPQRTCSRRDRPPRRRTRCPRRRQRGVSDVFTGDFVGDGLSLPELHVLLRLSIMLLGVLRVLWRMVTPLPPWATCGRGTAAGEGLLTLLFVVPGTGLLLIVGESDWLPEHIAAQVLLVAVIAVHVGLVLRQTVVRRDGQLRRMV